VAKWVTSPLNARTKMKIILVRRKKFEGKKMARLAMLSGVQMQVQIPTPMMMRKMRNPPRRVLPVLPLRRLHLYLTHLIVSWKKVN
jgi:hypothetical protein